MTEEQNEIRTGLWPKVAKKSGKEYLSGSIDGYWISYFKNRKPDATIEDPAGYLVMRPKDLEDYNDKTGEIFVPLYVKISKKGTKYISGNKEGRFFTMFANTMKKNPKAPDYNLLIAEKSGARQTRGHEMSAAPHEDPQGLEEPTQQDDFDDSDIPF